MIRYTFNLNKFIDYVWKNAQCEGEYPIKYLKNRTDVPESTLRRVIDGYSEPDYFTMRKICDAIGISMHDIVDAEEVEIQK